MVLSKDALPFIGTVTENGSFTGILEKAWLNETDVVPHLGMYLSRFEAVEFGTVFWMYRQVPFYLNFFAKSIGERVENIEM